MVRKAARPIRESMFQADAYHFSIVIRGNATSPVERRAQEDANHVRTSFVAGSQGFSAVNGKH